MRSRASLLSSTSLCQPFVPRNYKGRTALQNSELKRRRDRDDDDDDDDGEGY